MHRTVGLILFVALAMFSTGTWAQLASGSYVSLDGKMEHHFQPSGDYLGEVHNPDSSGAGVYRQAPEICWTTMNDGSRQYGNVMLYVGEVQCCLSVQPISDKYAFSEVWEKGTGFGYQMCSNQVFAHRND